jgi:hypothetical protein
LQDRICFRRGVHSNTSDGSLYCLLPCKQQLVSTTPWQSVGYNSHTHPAQHAEKQKLHDQPGSLYTLFCKQTSVNTKSWGDQSLLQVEAVNTLDGSGWLFNCRGCQQQQGCTLVEAELAIRWIESGTDWIICASEYMHAACDATALWQLSTTRAWSHPRRQGSDTKSTSGCAHL